MKLKNIIIIASLVSALPGCTDSDVENQINPVTDKHAALRQSLTKIASGYKAKIGVGVIELESGDTLSLNGKEYFAMQSVYKFPQALALLSKVEKNEIRLDQQVKLDKQMLSLFSAGALRRKNPGKQSMSIDSLLMYSICYSDNVGCDMIFQLMGGTEATNEFIHKSGFPDIHIKYTVSEMAAEVKRMYENRSTPVEMAALLKAFYERKIIGDTLTNHLLNFMTNDSTSHERIGGELPAGIQMAHKTGTGRYTDSTSSSCNDVAILTMPNGKHLAIAVFVMDANENFATAEKIIASLSKEIFNHFK